MEGTMSEIRMFGGSFEPKSWAYCAGQLLSINTNQALFSLLGTTYGGNGVQTFALPDLRGRVPMGTGSNPTKGADMYILGELNGFNTVTATLANLPPHTHGADGNAFTLKAYSDSGSIGSPTGNNLASLGGLYSNNPPDTSLNSINVAVSIAGSGGNQPISVQQPYLGLNYVICIYGIYPSRS